MPDSKPAEAFSRAAISYDHDFGDLPGVAELRGRVLRLVRQHVPVGSRILEIGCGTGADARALTAMRYRVLATDASEEMLNQARAKSVGESESLTFRAIRAEAIPAAFATPEFDAIFSNFGALNCVPNLADLLNQYTGILKPNGTMVICLISKFSLWELVALAGRMRFREAVRRIARSPVSVQVSGLPVPVWYYPLAAIRHATREKYRLVSVAGLNIVSPPPASQGFRRSFPRTSRVLDRLDEAVQHLPLLCRLGDHVVCVMKRTAGGSPLAEVDGAG